MTELLDAIKFNTEYAVREETQEEFKEYTKQVRKVKQNLDDERQERLKTAREADYYRRKYEQAELDHTSQAIEDPFIRAGNMGTNTTVDPVVTAMQALTLGSMTRISLKDHKTQSFSNKAE